MAGEDHRAIGERIEKSQTVEHRFRVATREIGSTAPVEEQGVTRHQRTVHVEALTARCVSGGVDALDLHPSDANDVAAVVLNEMVGPDAGGLLDPGSLVTVDVNRDVEPFEQTRHALDAVAHHRAADMIGVVVGGQHAGDAHAVGGGDVDQVVDSVGRIDHHAFA